MSYDAPTLSKDSLRRSLSQDRSGDEGVPQISPRYGRSSSARSTGSMDTEVLLKDTEYVMKAMEQRVEKAGNSQRKEFDPYSNSPVDKADLFLPIHDGDDTDDDVSAKVLNGEEDNVIEPPAPRTSKPRISATDNRIWGSKSSSNKEKVLAHYQRSRSNSKRNSLDVDSVGVSDDSESASVISTSTDYSAAASPKVTRKVPKAKGNITATRTNRAFALRRQNADSDTEPVTPRGSGRASGRSTSLTRPSSAGSSRSRESTHRAARPASAKESARSSARSDVSLGQKIIQKSRENHSAGVSNSSAGFVRKDGGRHSLRTQKSTPTAPSPHSSSRDSKKTMTRARSSTGSSLNTSGSAPTSSRTPTSGATSKSQDYEAWKRRKTYDPRKSLAASKNKKEEQQQQQQQQRRTRSAGQTSTDRWGRLSLSSEESSTASHRNSRTAEISQLSTSMTRDLATMTRQARHDNDDAFRVGLCFCVRACFLSVCSCCVPLTPFPSRCH